MRGLALAQVVLLVASTAGATDAAAARVFSYSGALPVKDADEGAPSALAKQVQNATLSAEEQQCWSLIKDRSGECPAWAAACGRLRHFFS